MAKFNVSKERSKLHIKIDETGSDQAAVLSALKECAEGRCTCPTSQYEKLESVDIAPGKDSIDIVLTPRAGETIDRQAIDNCLEYTSGKVRQK
jgi:hypothetical protein